MDITSATMPVTPVHSIEGKPLRIAWEGSQFVHHSLALVNRELCLALINSGMCDLNIIPYEPHTFGIEQDPDRFGLIQARMNRSYATTPQFHIRHQWPPNFNPPRAGRWIIMQPCEYGSMPSEWFPCFKNHVDEIWVNSSHTRECYIHDGIDPDKIAVIPNAVDTHRFRPTFPPYQEIKDRTQKHFKFLFVGGTIWRKGIDILLDAYVRAFSRQDDVTLVVKDMGNTSFYQGQGMQAEIQKIQETPDAPEIIYTADTIPDSCLPGLYTACDCLVHPYRGEGFGLPIAEAMACGLPVIVTRGGAADDFTSAESAYYVSAEWMKVKLDFETVKNAWVLNPDVENLVHQMKAAAVNPDLAKDKGLLAGRAVRSLLSWEKSAAIIMDRLKHLDRRSGHRPDGINGRLNTPDSTAEALNRQGKKLYQAGNKTAAELRFIWASEDPWSGAEPYNNLAVLYWENQKPEAAVQMLTQALRINPQDPSANENLSMITQALNRRPS